MVGRLLSKMRFPGTSKVTCNGTRRALSKVAYCMVGQLLSNMRFLGTSKVACNRTHRILSKWPAAWYVIC